MRTPQELLKMMRSATEDERKERYEAVMPNRPLAEWPACWTTPAYPLIQYIGVSPGNSPDGREKYQPGEMNVEVRSDYFTWGDSAQSQFYANGRNYWPKLRSLGWALADLWQPGIKEADAVELLAHLNLSKSFTGTEKGAIFSQTFVADVSTLTWRLGARVVIGCGLVSQLKHGVVSAHWATGEGYKLDWKNPVVKEFSYQTRSQKVLRLQLRYWRVENIFGEPSIFILLPNHPSRVPFGGGPDTKAWKDLELTIQRLVSAQLELV